MNNRKLQDLNIDNYVNWYKGLTKKAFALEVWEDRYKRLVVASYYLHSRYIQSEDNKQSKLIETAFNNQATKLNNEIKDLKKWMLEVDGKPIYFIPTFKDWQAFDYLNSFEPLTEILTGKINNSALPEIEILRDELERKNGEDLKLLECFETGTPLLYSNAKAFEFDFANEVSNINYCRHLAERIKELEAVKVRTTSLLKWQLDQKELSELIKALCLKKAFGNITETKVKEAFENMFDVNLKRHFTNINELQDKKQNEYFTTQLKTEIHNHILSLKPTK